VPESPDRQMFYLACESCRKKVSEEPGRGYYCERCSRHFGQAIPTYNFSVRVSDCSGQMSVACFGDIGETILGITAREFHQMHEDTAAVKNLAMNVLHTRQMALVVRAKIENERSMNAEGPSVRFTAVRTAQHSFKEANEGLLAHLRAYETTPEPLEQENVFF